MTPRSRSSFPQSKNKHSLDFVDDSCRLITHSQFKLLSLSTLSSAEMPLSPAQVHLRSSSCRIHGFPRHLPLQVLQILIHYFPKLWKTHRRKDAHYALPALNWESKQLNYIWMQVRALLFFPKRQNGPIYSHRCHSNRAEHKFNKLGSILLWDQKQTW